MISSLLLVKNLLKKNFFIHLIHCTTQINRLLSQVIDHLRLFIVFRIASGLVLSGDFWLISSRQSTSIAWLFCVPRQNPYALQCLLQLSNLSLVPNAIMCVSVKARNRVIAYATLHDAALSVSLAAQAL